MTDRSLYTDLDLDEFHTINDNFEPSSWLGSHEQSTALDPFYELTGHLPTKSRTDSLLRSVDRSLDGIDHLAYSQHDSSYDLLDLSDVYSAVPVTTSSTHAVYDDTIWNQVPLHDLSIVDHNAEVCHSTSLSLSHNHGQTSSMYHRNTDSYRSTTNNASWQSNCTTLRSLPRRRSTYTMRNNGGSRSVPIEIVKAKHHYSYQTDPLLRWKDSPPEDEPAPISAIVSAIESNPGQFPEQLEPMDMLSNLSNVSTSLGRCDGHHRAESTTSMDSATSNGSKRSERSVSSTVSSASRRSRNRVIKRSVPTKRKNTTDEKRMFKCTFCCDSFKHKYDWTRHEKSLHLNLEGWNCAPSCGTVAIASTVRRHCAYCHALDPTVDHLDNHCHSACHDITGQRRTFRRKDHLVQHLRLVHQLDAMPLFDDWKIKSPVITSRCGFCNINLISWDERTEHLAAHFRKGLTMDEWTGAHDFEPSVHAAITNAMPPWLLGAESRSITPFSATSSCTKDQWSQISWQLNRSIKEPARSPGLEPEGGIATLESFAQLLTRHLATYARQQMRDQVIPTDEMFQKEARRAMFDCEDSWNQTIADNAEWMECFRRKFVATASG